MPDLIVSSPLDRAVHTANIIAEEVGYDGRIPQMLELMERGGGDFQGQDIDRFYAASDQDIIDAGGESLLDFSDRLERAGVLLSVMALRHTVLVVGHAEAFRMATANVQGLPSDRYLEVSKPENAQIYPYPMTRVDSRRHARMTRTVGRMQRSKASHSPILIR